MWRITWRLGLASARTCRGVNLNLEGPPESLYGHRIEWLKAEVVFELRLRAGFSLTSGMGTAIAIRHVGAYCIGSVSWCADHSGWRYKTLPTFTTGVGYAF